MYIGFEQNAKKLLELHKEKMRLCDIFYEMEK